jgi:hypothetical protein
MDFTILFVWKRVCIESLIPLVIELTGQNICDKSTVEHQLVIDSAFISLRTFVEFMNQIQ